MKNVHILTAITFLFLSSVLTAQESTDTLKSREGDWGVVLNLTGFIDNISLGTQKDVNNNNNILVKHHLTDDKVLRLGLGLTSIRNNNFKADSISLSSGNRAWREVDSIETRFDFSLAVGYEMHFKGTKRLDPYLGAELVIGRIGNTKINASTNITDKLGTQKIQRIIQQDGGFAFGINLVSGFNLFVLERLSIGAEVNLGYLFSNAGGDQSESLVDTPVSGTQISSFSNSKNGVSRRGFDVNSSAGLLLSYYF
ncbi:MAG: hypothetical protein CVT95_05970 [Bacteroidetes bacterium HGW-Bacteroidetes-12]|nr:MAG: hypothetical protein CVT95_05970 [Bacteroidetes bacterium HGW-Bacteroidetes-12]